MVYGFNRLLKNFFSLTPSSPIFRNSFPSTKETVWKNISFFRWIISHFANPKTKNYLLDLRTLVYGRSIVLCSGRFSKLFCRKNISNIIGTHRFYFLFFYGIVLGGGNRSRITASGFTMLPKRGWNVDSLNGCSYDDFINCFMRFYGMVYFLSYLISGGSEGGAMGVCLLFWRFHSY